MKHPFARIPNAVGVVGASSTSEAVARALIAAGFLVFVADLDEEYVRGLVAVGAAPIWSLDRLACCCEMILFSLDDHEAAEVGRLIIEACPPGTVIFLLPPASETTAACLATFGSERRVAVFSLSADSDASRMGPTLTFGVRGDGEPDRRVMRVLTMIGRRVTYEGWICSGTATELPA